MLCLKLSDLYLIVMTCFFLYANLVKQSKSTIFICNVTALIFIGCCYKYHPFICRHILYHANQFSSKIVRTNGFNGSSLVEEVHSIIYCSSKDLKSYFVRRRMVHVLIFKYLAKLKGFFISQLFDLLVVFFFFIL